MQEKKKTLDQCPVVSSFSRRLVKTEKKPLPDNLPGRKRGGVRESSPEKKVFFAGTSP